MNPIDVLLARLRRARRWPLDAEMRVRVQLAMWAALRENDEAVLRRVMKWKADRDLVIDNLPEKIASAYGDLLFGTEPEWTPSNEADAQLVDDMTAGWDEGLPSAEETCVSEGEVWWRLTRAEGLDHPALTFHSRADVVPLLYGREVQAVAFVSTLPSATGERGVVDRHFELHGPGEIRNVLFRGRSNALGREMALDRSPETAGLPDVWRHGLPILAGRIVNRWGRRPHCGVRSRRAPPSMPARTSSSPTRSTPSRARTTAARSSGCWSTPSTPRRSSRGRTTKSRPSASAATSCRSSSARATSGRATPAPPYASGCCRPSTPPRAAVRSGTASSR
jgi:hypothetical protein